MRGTMRKRGRGCGRSGGGLGSMPGYPPPNGPLISDLAPLVDGETRGGEGDDGAEDESFVLTCLGFGGGGGDACVLWLGYLAGSSGKLLFFFYSFWFWRQF